MATFQELMEAARKADKAGDEKAAKRFLQLAKEQEQPQKNPDGTYGKQPEADMSFLGRLKDNFVGVDDGVMSVGEKVGTALNMGGEAMTLGLVGDEASAAVESVVPGVNYEDRRDHYREEQEKLETQNPIAALGAQVGGGVVGALLPGGAIGNMARGGMLAKAGASATAGAGMGGVYGFTEGEGDERLSDALDGAKWGAGIGAAAPVAAAGAKRVVDSLLSRAPKRQAIKAAKTAAGQRAESRGQYRAFEDANAQISPDAMGRLQGQVSQRIDDAGAPNIPGPLGRKPKAGRDINATIGAMIEEADAGQQAINPQGRYGIPLKAIEDVRKEAGILGREVDNIGRPTRNANIASQAVNEIDQFIDALQPEDMVAGDANIAITALKKARNAWKSARKTQMLENIEDRADSYLGGEASGIRNQIKSLIKQNKKTKLFSKAEIEALKKVQGNTMLGRTLRLVGDGLGAKIATFGGGAAGGPLGMLAGRAASEVAGGIADSATKRNMETAKALIASGNLQNLPQLSDAKRQIIEQLARRGGVAASQ
jgi:hypothetical protein